ncbi:MAG: hypothetical protein WBE86_16990 [Candidatus Acidiferrales bacterium]
MKNLSVALATALLCFGTMAPIHRAWAGQNAKSSSVAPTSAQQRAEADIKIGDLANENGNEDEAIADYKAAIEADPGIRDAHQKLFQAYRQKAYAFLTPKKIKAAKKKPTKAQQQAKQEEAQARQKKLEAKLENSLLVTYDKWIKKNLRQPMFYWGKAQILEDQDKNAEAKSLLHQAIAIGPSCAPAYEDLSDFAATDGDVAAQRQYAEKALALDPKGSAGVFFNYALTYLSTDPPKFRQVVLDRVAKYPDGLEYLLVLVAQNAPSPTDEEAAYQKLYQLYGPKSADPSGDVSDVMVEAFNVYANTDPSRALSFAQQMQKDQAEELAKKAAAEANGKTSKNSDAKGPKPLWQSITDFQGSLIGAQALISQKKYADAQALLAKNALKPKNDFDSLSGVDQTPYQLATAQALAGNGDTQKAYESVKTALLPQPDEALHGALLAYGAKLGKTPEQVDQDVWQARESKAKPMTPFALKQYVTGNEIKLADYRGQVVLVNFWFPG